MAEHLCLSLKRTLTLTLDTLAAHARRHQRVAERALLASSRRRAHLEGAVWAEWLGAVRRQHAESTRRLAAAYSGTRHRLRRALCTWHGVAASSAPSPLPPRAAAWSHATLARHAWDGRRRAMAALRLHARARTIATSHSQQADAHRRRCQLKALATARHQWSCAVAAGRTDALVAARQRLTMAQAVAERSGLSWRRLAHAWRRWRAALLARNARQLRLHAAATLGDRKRSLHGFVALLRHTVTASDVEYVLGPDFAFGGHARWLRGE